MEEIWKDIKGYEGLYQISSLGRVKSLSRKISNEKRTYLSKEKILKIHLRKDGYCRIGLTKNKKQQQFLVHRLVSHAFIPNPENKPCINHKDGDKENNYVNNLEWCTSSENNKHAFKTGLNDNKGEKSHFAKLNEKQVRIIKWLLENSDLYLREIAELFEISFQQISRIKNNKRWKHINN